MTGLQELPTDPEPSESGASEEEVVQLISRGLGASAGWCRGTQWLYCPQKNEVPGCCAEKQKPLPLSSLPAGPLLRLGTWTCCSGLAGCADGTVFYWTRQTCVQKVSVQWYQHWLMFLFPYFHSLPLQKPWLYFLLKSTWIKAVTFNLNQFNFSWSVTQLCLTLCDTMDSSPSASSVHGIFQARILEWVTISFSRGSSQPRDQMHVSCIAGIFFTCWATGEAPRWHWK